jgi:hypothetical protein
MAMQLGHVHIKTREDPQKVAKFYIELFLHFFLYPHPPFPLIEAATTI